MIDVKIDSEFKNLIPPLSPDELSELEASLVAEGNRVPIDVWQGVIVDGHSRYEICQRLSISLKDPNELKLGDRLDVKIWIVRNQFGRRNINPYVRGVLALKLEDMFREKAEKNLVTSTGGKNPQPLPTLAKADTVDTREELAKIAKVSHGTIAKVKQIEQKAPPEIKEKLTKGDPGVSINSVYKDIKRQERRDETEKKRQEIVANAAPAEKWVGDFKLDVISVGDIMDFVLPPDSVDMVFTDPPYQEDCVALYERLAIVSAICLKSGGYLLTYAGKMFIPEILSAMRDCLEYVSAFAVFQPFSQSRIVKHNLFENWRPILVFKKSGETATREWVQDVVRGKRDKEFHDWQQDMEAPRQYIAAYTKPGDVVLDPFAGGGTTICVCKELGRRFIAIDSDEESIKLATKRLQDG